MKLLYFFLTSSFMIGLVLLFRNLFRKKLSANVIYALWLLPFLRLLLPVGFLEVPVFGTVAEFINRPVAVVEEFFKEPIQKTPGIYEEPLADSKENKENIDSVEIYDAVIPKENFTVQIPERDVSLNDYITDETTNNHSLTNHIILTIWCAGSLVLGCYVFVQNRKLRRIIDQLEAVDQIDGIDICISNVIKTPCLIGVHNLKIVLTGEVYVSTELYKYAILHEIAHYHNKDHIWNMARIFLCILYWWHPLVWYAAKCTAEDAELACDERVLKGKTVEERKNYGYALLKMIENAQNKPLCLTTSFSGSKKSMKHRIEAISHKTTTRKCILFPALLVLVSLLIVGCVYPSNKSYIKTTDWEIGETDEYNYNEAKFEYSLQNNFKSILLYYENYEYGKLTERNILSYGELEEYTNIFLLRDESYKSVPKRNLVVEMNGIETCIPIPKYDIGGAYAISRLHSVNDLIEITPGDDLILMAFFLETNNEKAPSYSCEILSSYDEHEIKSILNKNETVCLARLILSDLPSETLYEQMRKRAYPEMLSLDEYNEKYSNQQVNDNNAIYMSEVKLVGNSTNAAQIIKQAEERAKEGYKEAKLTYVDNAEVGWNFYNDNPWASAAERDALAQAALKELYTLTGYNVEECTYTTNGRSKFIFGKSAENIKKSIAFYSRDYGFTLYGDEIPFMGFVNARKVHYSDVQQLDSPYHKKETQGNGAIAAWFLEHSGVYQGEKIIGFDAINLDDTVYTHMKLTFDGGYYIVLMDEKIESFHSAEGPFFE